MVDVDGYRPNVGIIMANDVGQVLWARRIGQDNAWQFPQGGIAEDETPQEALYRELKEEIGLLPEQVELVACTRGWLKYRLPQRYIRQNQSPLCIGQKQKWFLLKMKCADQVIQLDASSKPEFDGWQWVSYWYPVTQVVAFKRQVYRRALTELAPRFSSQLAGIKIQHAEHTPTNRPRSNERPGAS